MENIFSLPGVGILPIYDACLAEGVEIIGCRHEQAVVQAAEGWARVTGRPAVALLAEGPGIANGMAGIIAAWSEYVPVVVVSAMDETRRSGKGAIQEIPQVEMCGPVTKWSTMVPELDLVGEYIERAFQTAVSGVPGPVHLCFPADVLEQTAGSAQVHRPDPNVPVVADLPRATLELALDLLAGAKRPVIMAGTTAYWSACAERLLEFVETTRIPLFTVERARGMVSDDHPLCFGDAYTTVNPAAALMQHADVVMVLGERIDCRFAYGLSFGHADIIHVYPDPDEIGKNRDAKIAFSCDTRPLLDGLLQAAGRRSWQERAEWLEALRKARAEHAGQMTALAASGEAPPHPLRICREIARFVDDQTVLVFDGGDVSGWARSYFKARRPGGWQVGTILGQMGAGMYYALGAGIAEPGSRIVLITGDGALGFGMMDFETAVRHGIPVVVVVGNDAAWGIEVHFQKEWYGPDRLIATQLGDVRWDRIAEAMGGFGAYVDTPAMLGPALEQAFASGKAACVNVAIGSVPSPQALAYSRVFSRRRKQIRSSGARRQ